MKHRHPVSASLLVLACAVALSACKKNEEAAPSDMAQTPPAATAPATPATDPAAPPPMTAAAPVSVTDVVVGTSAAADKSVTRAALVAPKDKIVVSIKTDGAATGVTVGAKLSFQDGQVAGEQNATLNTAGAETTNIEFSNANGWPAGKYTAEVTVNGQPAGTTQTFEVK